ncbi:uncharacterized protein EV420DRAFT_1650658 [Desarmillaria tabescens]|uniref:Uncharacterized protein n=1 Tax=Armillaria tabescens TaxID=1929756 RepID=A0AA39JC22_ARMTA|nr:uncharacterized protein EV420DRAFT_1650658 [Desarmillaria tabescens]KAK0439986.1 hypothetical protein EV420DRAFT_1650658 [Desarmillaria tabescens]
MSDAADDTVSEPYSSPHKKAPWHGWDKGSPTIDPTNSEPWPDPPQLPDWDTVIVPNEALTDGYYPSTAQFAHIMQKLMLLGPEDDDDAEMLQAYEEIYGTMSLAVDLHGFQLINEVWRRILVEYFRMTKEDEMGELFKNMKGRHAREGKWLDLSQ